MLDVIQNDFFTHQKVYSFVLTAMKLYQVLEAL